MPSKKFRLPSISLATSDSRTGSWNSSPSDNESGQCDRCKSERRYKTFKGLVNFVGKGSKWAKLANEEVQDQHVSRNTVNATVVQEKRTTFNVNAYKSHVRSVGALSSNVKKALVESPWNRTAEDLANIQMLVMRIKAFESYSKFMKTELSRVMVYQQFGKGRVVLQQGILGGEMIAMSVALSFLGHVGVSFYFILSGTVTVQREEKDYRTGETHIQVLGEMSEGDAFGELALLQNSTRTATIVCKTRCELLKIDREDIEKVLRNSEQYEYKEKLKVFNEQSYFHKWSKKEIRSACTDSKIIVFPGNSIILKDVVQDYVHFVLFGKCKVIRELTVVKTSFPFRKDRLTLVPPGKSPRLSKYQSLEKRFLVLLTIREGGYFGVGENLNRTWIVSDDKVECLLVNRVAFMKRDNGRELAALHQKLVSLFPDERQAFQCYLKKRNWRKYKKALIDELVRRRCKPSNTNYRDIPHAIRSTHEHYIKKI